MKKTLRIDASIIAGLVAVSGWPSACEHLYSFVPEGTVVEFSGIDFGDGVLLFDVEHDDIENDIAFTVDGEDKGDASGDD